MVCGKGKKDFVEPASPATRRNTLQYGLSLGTHEIHLAPAHELPLGLEELVQQREHAVAIVEPTVISLMFVLRHRRESIELV